MIIATRTLTLRTDGGDVEVPIRICAPEQQRVDWVCRYEVDWPEGKVERWGAGVDAIQALYHALTMIGIELYASQYHEAGRLEWLAPDQGYGFPVANNVRDLLIGDDKRYL